MQLVTRQQEGHSTCSMFTSWYLALIAVTLENDAVKQKSTVIEKSNSRSIVV